MQLVIFGAGASYDSASTYVPGSGIPTAESLNFYHRPPCVNELFQDRPLYAEVIERFPECQPIVPRLRSLRGETRPTNRRIVVLRVLGEDQAKM